MWNGEAKTVERVYWLLSPFVAETVLLSRVFCVAQTLPPLMLPHIHVVAGSDQAVRGKYQY